jgi:predicted permease
MRRTAAYRALLWLYPAAFRHEYGGEMARTFAEQLSEAGGPVGRAGVWRRAIADLFAIAPQEHLHVIFQDVRYALRTMAARPGFATVAIFSLALGVGANTALYSLWHGVLNASLPVREPERLVMLTNPDSAGVGVGSFGGDRPLLSYAEFEQLRDRAGGFESLMASESGLDRRQIRIGSGDWETVRTRMVSGGYFETLGVAPVLGRAFTPADDRAPAPYAVLSYPYWQRRFDGRHDVLGRSLTIRHAKLTIIGVAPPGFFGETSGQQPDLWAPLSMQPGILPGRDWLHDTGQEKVMWLHVFGRLRPGVTPAQVEAGANAVFKAGLEAFYGSVLSAEGRREFLDQRLRVRPAAAGASTVRRRFSAPLQVLLGAVGVLLLIACANLANLLLARGAARRSEIALRISLGASRGRLVRQLITESLTLAAAGGLAGLAAAYLFHRALAGTIASADERFTMSFRLEPRVLAFSFLVTLSAAAIFALLPAWQTANAGSILHAQGRSLAGRLRWGRLLVAGQLALSLPLVAGAALLVRTLQNLQQTDLGYPRERLFVVYIDAQTAGYDAPRRQPLFRRILEDLRRLPGVRAATYSDNGVFSGRTSGDNIEVEGYTPRSVADRDAGWDQVAPDYFSTLGLPIRLGRAIDETDLAGSPRVCVINESFARRFFAGRNPLGMHITTVYGDTRETCQIAGVAKDARTQSLRREIGPLFYVPVTQPRGEMDGAVFILRTAGQPEAVLGGVRQAIRRIDPTLPVVDARTVEQSIGEATTQDRITANLAAVFGLVALALAAIGLFGVLSYGVARRQTEIGVRIALGALPRQVVGMILRETSVLILAGFALGAALAFAAARLIASQLYGVAPTDPLALSLAAALLVSVALAAAWLPARRAARLDPIAALRRE